VAKDLKGAVYVMAMSIHLHLNGILDGVHYQLAMGLLQRFGISAVNKDVVEVPGMVYGSVLVLSRGEAPSHTVVGIDRGWLGDGYVDSGAIELNFQDDDLSLVDRRRIVDGLRKICDVTSWSVSDPNNGLRKKGVRAYGLGRLPYRDRALS
jgi:hypothetical protein